MGRAVKAFFEGAAGELGIGVTGWQTSVPNTKNLAGLVFGIQGSRFLEQEEHRLNGCLAAAFVTRHMPGTDHPHAEESRNALPRDCALHAREFHDITCASYVDRQWQRLTRGPFTGTSQHMDVSECERCSG